MNWNEIINFSESEFECPCCKRSPMNEALITDLQKVRTMCGFGFMINSGFRCERHNISTAGGENSAHLRGHAVDIHAPSSRKRFNIVKNALLIGFNRIGIAKTFVHLDNDPSLPSNVVWLYR